MTQVLSPAIVLATPRGAVLPEPSDVSPRAIHLHHTCSCDIGRGIIHDIELHIVVEVGDRDVGRIEAVEACVGARSHAKNDRVRHIAVCQIVVAPVMVTVCGTFQLSAVKTRLVTEATPSDALLEATGIWTSAVGAVESTTLKLAVAPASLVMSG